MFKSDFSVRNCAQFPDFAPNEEVTIDHRVTTQPLQEILSGVDLRTSNF